ncbi:Fic family protein [Patescibacteria group bacterium]|nr:Fic family protein [Patescibacteria group bacterium]MBU1931380.1 Fic family protein [Patescibacteria group bacterium]
MFQPNFTISQAILKNIGSIEASKEVIENAPLIPAWEVDFKENALIRTIHHGTHIEGNDLTLNQAKQVINGQQITARERDVQEVINYRNVLKYIDKIGNTPEKYTETELKKLHWLTCGRLLENDRCGTYRTVRVVVKDSGSGTITFNPPPPIEINPQIKEFFRWLNSEEAHQIHPVLRAGIVHYELVRIHPFLDGNGRVARAIATLVLFRENYNIKRFFSLEEHYDKDAASYYRALQLVDKNQQDLTCWLEYFTEVLAIELAQIKDKVKRLSLDLRIKQKAGQQIALSERQIKLMEYLGEHKEMSMRQAIKLIPMVSDDTLLRDLKDLLKKGILVKRGRTKAAKYVLKEVA